MKKFITLLLVFSFIFSMNVSAATKVTFTDISGHWAEKEIVDLADKGLIGGVGNNKFSPNTTVKVDEFIKLCLTSIGYNFDVSKYPYWGTPYINKAIELGIIGKKEFTNYQRAITREEMSSIVIKSYGKVDTIFGSSLNQEIVKSIGDYSLINDYYKDSVLKCYNVGLMQGNKGLFKPKSPSTRAEAVAVISRILKPENRTPFTFDAPYTTATYMDWTDDMGWMDFQVKVYAPKSAKGKYETQVLDLYNFATKNATADKSYYEVFYNPYNGLIGSDFLPFTYDQYEKLGENDKAKYTQLSFSVDMSKFGKSSNYPYQLIAFYDGIDKVTVFKENYGMFLDYFFENLFGTEASYAKDLFYKVILDPKATEYTSYVINGRNVRVNQGMFDVSEKLD